MTFNSFEFIGYFIIVLLVLALIDRYAQSNKIRNIFLLVSSLVFYAFFNVYHLFILIFVVIYTYIFALRIREKSYLLKLGIAFAITILFIYKYFNFFIDSFLTLFRVNNSLTIELLLPIGVSFYLFKSISYLVDVSKGVIEPENNFVNVALYICFFPELLAGPISRSNDLITQLKENRRVNITGLSIGFQMFLIGLFKKIVLADNISVFVNEIYRAPKIFSSMTIILCIIAYSFQIYLDFSGYSDMAIGCSKMLGFDIKKNFNMPYLSHNVTEFWKRWHISLSSWLQDYIYIPLGGNRKGRRRQYINLIITMIIGGLWHGSKMTFIVWGLVNGVALVIHKIYSEQKRGRKNSMLSILFTFAFVSLTWVIFRSGSLKDALCIYSSIFNGFGINYIHINTIVCIIIALSMMVISYKTNNSESFYLIQDLNTVKGLVCVILLIGVIIGFAYTGFNPFIYSSF